MNPDQVIATLSGGADCKLYMELTITKGRGYVSSDKNKSDDLPIGVLAVDSIYTPVERVNMTVENTRVGHVTDYDKLTLDVYTNGTLGPDEAVSLAAKVLSDHLNLFIDLSENAKTAEVMVEKEDNEKEKVLEMNIDELELSVRSYNCLKRAGINTVEELTNRTAEDMMKVYIHLPPVMKDEHHKLSKRNGDASFQDLVAKGYLPAAILNYIALLKSTSPQSLTF